MTKQELAKLLDEKLRGVVTKEDLKALATKNDIEAMERRLMARFDGLFNYLDKDVMENRKGLKVLEREVSQLQVAIG